MDTMRPVIEQSLKAWMPSPWAGLLKPKSPSALLLYSGVEWLVSYDYQKSEPETRDHPGSPGCVEINEVHLLNHPHHSCLLQFLDEGVVSEMEAKLLEQLETER